MIYRKQSITFQGEDLFAKTAQGVDKIFLEVLLLIKFQHT